MKNTYTVIANGSQSVTVEYKGTDLAEAIANFKRIDESRYLKADIYINGEKVKFN